MSVSVTVTITVTTAIQYSTLTQLGKYCKKREEEERQGKKKAEKCILHDGRY